MNGFRPLPLVIALLVGIGIGAGVAFVLTPTEQSASPSYATQSGTGCSEGQPPSGWIGQLADDDERYVLVNVTFVHETAGLDLSYDLAEVSQGTYRFAITSTPTTAKGEPPSDCQPRTTLQASISLPDDFDTLEITRDGDRITTVRNTGESFPSFRVLPNSSSA